MAALGLLSMLLPVSQTAHAQGDRADSFVAPTVFQAAGPTAAWIQSTVDAFRAALGDPNNGNNPGPLASGRREINWDGGDPNILDTTAPVTPFDVFLNTRGAHFTTPGLGLSQAPPSGGPEGGLAVLFNNPTYGTIFTTFSPSRLFTPVGSNVTDGSFFVPGTTGASPATVTGFGAVFTDVDLPDGGGRRQRAGTRSRISIATVSGYSAVLSRPRPATRACPSSESNSTMRASRRSGSRPMRPRVRTMIAGMTSS